MHVAQRAVRMFQSYTAIARFLLIPEACTAVERPRRFLWQTDVAQGSTGPRCFQSRPLWLSGFEAQTEGADMSVLDKPQSCHVCCTERVAQGQTTFAPTLPRISQLQCEIQAFIDKPRQSTERATTDCGPF